MDNSYACSIMAVVYGINHTEDHGSYMDILMEHYHHMVNPLTLE